MYISDVIDLICYILCSFNKKEEEFPTLKEYNDYLEKIEEISKCDIIPL